MPEKDPTLSVDERWVRVRENTRRLPSGLAVSAAAVPDTGVGKEGECANVAPGVLEEDNPEVLKCAMAALAAAAERDVNEPELLSPRSVSGEDDADMAVCETRWEVSATPASAPTVFGDITLDVGVAGCSPRRSQSESEPSPANETTGSKVMPAELVEAMVSDFLGKSKECGASILLTFLSLTDVLLFCSRDKKINKIS